MPRHNAEWTMPHMNDDRPQTNRFGPRSLGILAGCIALGCVASVRLLDHAIDNGVLPHLVLALAGTSEGPSNSKSLRGIDYTPTGSIRASNGRAIVLDPCTGGQK